MLNKYLTFKEIYCLSKRFFLVILRKRQHDFMFLSLLSEMKMSMSSFWTNSQITMVFSEFQGC